MFSRLAQNSIGMIGHGVYKHTKSDTTLQRMEREKSAVPGSCGSSSGQQQAGIAQAPPKTSRLRGWAGRGRAREVLALPLHLLAAS